MLYMLRLLSPLPLCKFLVVGALLLVLFCGHMYVSFGVFRSHSVACYCLLVPSRCVLVRCFLYIVKRNNQTMTVQVRRRFDSAGKRPSRAPRPRSLSPQAKPRGNVAQRSPCYRICVADPGGHCRGPPCDRQVQGLPLFTCTCYIYPVHGVPYYVPNPCRGGLQLKEQL